MNVLKHMEAAFLFSLSVAGAASMAIDAIPPAQASVPVQAQVSVQPSMPVVHVSAKRMSADEKRQALQAERAALRDGSGV
jgi:surface antigen